MVLILVSLGHIHPKVYLVPSLKILTKATLHPLKKAVFFLTGLQSLLSRTDYEEKGEHLPAGKMREKLEMVDLFSLNWISPVFLNLLMLNNSCLSLTMNDFLSVFY